MTFNLCIVAGLFALVDFSLAGCDSRDPYRRTDVWQPTGSNAANIAAMLANPHDVISGRGDSRENAAEPALAVTHVWLDQPKPLAGGAAGGGASGGGSGGGASGGGASGSPGS
jgi:type IV pilus biogenesis protein CpaD/CtpE